MADELAIHFSLLGKIYGLSGKKIFRWYQQSSRFLKIKQKRDKALNNKDGTPKKRLKKAVKIQRLKKIWRSCNFGTKMAIDEKYIGGVFYTILTNIKTSKVAAVLQTVKGKEIKECLYTLPSQTRSKVKVLTRDLAQVLIRVLTRLAG